MYILIYNLIIIIDYFIIIIGRRPDLAAVHAQLAGLKARPEQCRYITYIYYIYIYYLDITYMYITYIDNNKAAL